jgi:hypothetical protein
MPHVAKPILTAIIVSIEVILPFWPFPGVSFIVVFVFLSGESAIPLSLFKCIMQSCACQNKQCRGRPFSHPIIEAVNTLTAFTFALKEMGIQKLWNLLRKKVASSFLKARLAMLKAVGTTHLGCICTVALTHCVRMTIEKFINVYATLVVVFETVQIVQTSNTIPCLLDHMRSDRVATVFDLRSTGGQSMHIQFSKKPNYHKKLLLPFSEINCDSFLPACLQPHMLNCLQHARIIVSVCVCHSNRVNYL